jgi:hypothetical protein
MIRAKRFLASENLAKSAAGCKMFPVEQRISVEIVPVEQGIVPCGTFHDCTEAKETALFHVEQFGTGDSIIVPGLWMDCYT